MTGFSNTVCGGYLSILLRSGSNSKGFLGSGFQRGEYVRIKYRPAHVAVTEKFLDAANVGANPRR
jgi:hypothetical protein